MSIARKLSIIVALCVPLSAFAENINLFKCVSNGKTTYQDFRCEESPTRISVLNTYKKAPVNPELQALRRQSRAEMHQREQARQQQNHEFRMAKLQARTEKDVAKIEADGLVEAAEKLSKKREYTNYDNSTKISGKNAAFFNTPAKMIKIKNK